MKTINAAILAPIASQLRQGTTPEKIALTIALGVVIGIFPILSATTVLCGIAGKFFADFGMIAVAGIVVWCVVAPLFAVALYFGLRSPIRGLATRMRRTAVAKA